jgi:nucleotide-binding universal stress UspA family protein
MADDRHGTAQSLILLAVHDSPASMRAAHVALALARDAGAALVAVTVVPDGPVADALARTSPEPGAEGRRRAAADAVLRHVLAEAGREGVPAEGRVLAGPAGAAILRAAEQSSAGLIVVGRTESPDPLGHIGDVALHILELAEVPVVAVP